MKKGAPAAPTQPEPVAVVQETEPVKELPQSGYGRFEYVNGTMYSGNWKLHQGAKVKHGHGKITFKSFGQSAGSEVGYEEYEGDWEDDLMQGYGTYRYISGAVYTGQWSQGRQEGKGAIKYPDGSSYEGTWLKNQMHGEGCYVDAEGIRWPGIYVEGSFESKLQKKL